MKNDGNLRNVIQSFEPNDSSTEEFGYNMQDPVHLPLVSS